MNRNTARRCLTGIDSVYRTQIWTGPPYWLLRTRLWDAANLPVPKRIEIREGHITKTRLAEVVDDYTLGSIPASTMPGRFQVCDQDVVAVAPPLKRRHHQAIAANEAWFRGLSAIVAGHAEAWDLRVNLNRGAVSWVDTSTGQTLAVLAGMLNKPEPITDDEASAA